ncbi:hypothetical protein ABG067_001813 [Albugo candida]
MNQYPEISSDKSSIQRQSAKQLEALLLNSKGAEKNDLQNETCILDADFLIAQAGNYDLNATKELILREVGITDIDPHCAQALFSLEILSLSHNRLSSLDHFHHFVNLIELNLNFNRISSLEPLKCTQLEKLFVAHNEITDLSPIRSFSKLTTLCVFGNQLSNLESVLHVCRALPKLQSLDIGDNPSTRQNARNPEESKGATRYKFTIIRNLPRLRQLDGDSITRLDKDLADEEVEMLGECDNNECSIPPPRPITGNKCLASAQTRNPSAFDPFSSEEMPQGNVRLFRDEYLNNHPILLGYLAKSADGSVDESITAPRRESTLEASMSARNGAGFVERMRNANSEMDDSNLLQTEERDLEDTGRSTPILDLANVSMQTTHSAVDPSDPNTTIRKLVNHIERLQVKIEKLQRDPLSHSYDLLREENKRLLLENRNISILQHEICQLKERPSTAHCNGGDTTRLKSLEIENAQLHREIHRLQMLATNDPGVEKSKTTLSSDQELLHDSSTFDLELTELIMQNEVSLDIIRKEITATKREWEEEYLQSKPSRHITPSSIIRPSTSLGFRDDKSPTISNRVSMLPRKLNDHHLTSNGPTIHHIQMTKPSEH